MVKLEKITVAEAKATRREVRKKPIIQEYEQILKDLKPGDALRVDAKEENEKPQTIKNRIIRLGKSLGMEDLRVQRRGDKIAFWLEKGKVIRLREPAPRRQSDSKG